METKDISSDNLDGSIAIITTDSESTNRNSRRSISKDDNRSLDSCACPDTNMSSFDSREVLQDEETKRENKRRGMESMDASDDEVGQMTYKINDIPAWYLCIILGFQQFLTMLGSTVALPSVLGPVMCIRKDETVATSEILATLFFVSGIGTLVQATFGIRLPIVQGGTYAFLVSAIAILSLEKWRCPPIGLDESSSPKNESINSTSVEEEEEEEGIWKSRMRELQGAIIVASIFEVIIGVTGMIGVIIRFIGPITISSCICLIGISLFRVASSNCAGNWYIAFTTMGLIALFSQYLRNISIPCFTFSGRKCGKTSFPIFKLFPIIIAITLSWFICYILTVSNAVPNDPGHWAYRTRTDISSEAIEKASWFRVPYPFQWGLPTFSVASIFGMIPGVFAGIVESIGDYYACARISGAPTPPVNVINRGIFIEGILCILSGMFGTGTGTTSYSENIGAIGITKAGSRRIIQTSGVIMIICGMMGKFGALFIAIPSPVIGGVFTVMFGMIASVGISNLQFVDLNSSRNMFVFGFSVLLGLSIPDWLNSNPGAINTGNEIFDQIVLVLGSTSMFIGGAVALVLDSTIPGTRKERGLDKWMKQHVGDGEGGKDGVVGDETFDFPFGMAAIRRWKWSKYIPISPTFTGFSFNARSLCPCCKTKEQISNENENGLSGLKYDNSSRNSLADSRPTLIKINENADTAL